MRLNAAMALNWKASANQVFRVMVLSWVSLVSACAVGPEYISPTVNLPSSWTTVAKSSLKPARVGEWWRAFSEPALDALVSEAIANNLDAAKARAKVREARATLRQQTAQGFPAVTGTSLAQRSTSSSAATGTDIPSQAQDLFRAGLDASWEIDLFGANRRAVEALDAALEATQEDLSNSLVTLVGDVVANYVDGLGYSARIALAQQSARSQRRTAQLISARVAAGSASEVDLAKALAQAATTEASIPSLEEARAGALHRLGVLLGRPPGPLPLQRTRSGAIPKPRYPIATGVPAQVLIERPDIRAAERRLAQVTAQIGQSEAARYPSVSLSGSISTSAQHLGDLARQSALGWSWGPTLTVPLFDAGKRREAVNVSRAQRDQSLLDFHRAVLAALEDVENALVSLNAERRRLRRLQQAVSQYQRSAELSRTLYESGSIGFLDLLDAERSYYSASDSLLQSQIRLSKNYIALAKALGRGWDGARPDLDVRHAVERAVLERECISCTSQGSRP